MFNLFKNTPKQYKPIAEYLESWNILKDDNQAMVVRLNAGCKDAAGHPDYPIKMGVAVPFKGEDNDRVVALKNSIEDAIDKILNKGEKGVLVTVITSFGEQKFIEFLSYTKNTIDFSLIHKTLKEKFPGEDVQMYAESDPTWSAYQTFLK